MKQTYAKAMLGLMAGLAIGTTAQAAVVNVGNATAGVQGADIIDVSTTWTANNTYNIRDQIWVVDGATLTIEPGTVIASAATETGKGSIAITRGSMIIANGTEDNPIIFTSDLDVATWANLPAHPTGKDPKTGTWREEANEWGNVTIMGRGFVSAGCVAGNVNTCNGNNIGAMEGLVPPPSNPPTIPTGSENWDKYGGNEEGAGAVGSGSMKYVSLRYGGRVQAINTELNGLSLGGVNRNTTIEHIEIMNNVDDGIEIWGGNVNVKWFSVWNIGDDSFDIDQGWRGKAQFGLIVQGYSVRAAQGSGSGDNALELDGAEHADWQPATTGCLYNFTVIGMPGNNGCDNGTEWRDNARMQIRNSIFMNLGEELVERVTLAGTECTANEGDGFGGTLTFAQRFAQDYTYAPNGSDVNACTNPSARYQAQSAGNASIQQGRLNEITDSVFFSNNFATAYTVSDSVNVTVGGDDAPLKGNIVAANSPIKALTRAAAVNYTAGVNNFTMLRVTGIDPRARNEAMTSVSQAPDDGFFHPAQYRGAFRCNENWLENWTAADAYGFSVSPCSADVECSDAVDINDLLLVINTWGPCPSPCPAKGFCGADVDQDCNVNINDLLDVINNWGPCP